MTREEYDSKMELNLEAAWVIDMYILAHEYVTELEQRITELKAHKTCDGCKHIDSKGRCYDCSRYYIDYYEPKDK